ncbi:MAG: L,D-transpeptidase family protein [Proteobacteria bacterium]|nr:L,D-transpeptidase family protein [Pseudomonadota bacterium]
MMIKSILTIFAAVAVSAAGTSVVLAQGYPRPPGSVYSDPPSAAPADYGRPSPMAGVPDYDAVDDDQAADRQNSAGLPPPGPVMSPDDPRYGRPAGGPPVYSDRGAPQGPVMSPDDPRYGRPSPPPQMSDRGPPGPQGGSVTGSLQPPAPIGTDGRPTVLSALPPDDQPEADQGGEKQLAPNLRRQEVNFVTKEPAGTIVVDTPNTYLYYVLGNNRAIRYGVRVGRDGFTWTGVQKISRKAEWPDWHPPTEMIERQPYLPRFMAGGPGNPLGARAMYLGSTVYRIHGTNQPSTIGHFVSSGCIGMLNEDVENLFDRVKVGTRVVVLPGGAPHTDTTTASAQPDPGAAPQPQTASLPGTQPTAVAPLPAPVTIR